MDSDRIRRVLIAGIGGVGGYFGGLLARRYGVRGDGAEATIRDAVLIEFLARGEHLEVIRRKGLTLDTSENSGLVCRPHRSSDTLTELEVPDLCLVCVKGYDLDAICAQLAGVMTKHGVILPLLNGVDIRQRIRRQVRTGIVLPACVYVSASIQRPGAVSQKGMAGLLICGPDPEHPEHDPAPVVQLLKGAGINTRLETDAYPAIWEKYLFIASFGLVTAWAAQPFGAVLENAELRGFVRTVMQEIAAVAAKQGIHFADGIVDASLKKAESFPYETKTSYQRDVEKGSRSEGDLFGGTIVRLGRELGVPTPLTERLQREIGNQ